MKIGGMTMLTLDKAKELLATTTTEPHLSSGLRESV